MTRRHTKTLVSALTAVALWAGSTAPALGHGDAVLEADRSSVAPGENVALEGTDFDGGDEHRLRLLGSLDEHDLGTVRADSTGRFTRRVTVPPDARAGRYRLVALAGDGDEVASVRLKVVRSAGERAGRSEGRGEGPDREPRVGEMSLPRERNGLEWGLVVLLLGGAAGLGFVSIRRSL